MSRRAWVLFAAVSVVWGVPYFFIKVAVDADPQVKAWWHVAGINAQRLEMTDHSWVHIQIVTNIALRLARLLSRAGVVGSMVRDHGMTERCGSS